MDQSNERICFSWNEEIHNNVLPLKWLGLILLLAYCWLRSLAKEFNILSIYKLNFTVEFFKEKFTNSLKGLRCQRKSHLRAFNMNCQIAFQKDWNSYFQGSVKCHLWEIYFLNLSYTDDWGKISVSVIQIWIDICETETYLKVCIW